MAMENSVGNAGQAIARRRARVTNGVLQRDRVVVGDLGDPPPPLAEHNTVALELESFVRAHGAQESVVQIAIGFLDRSYLMSLPLPWGGTGLW
jgi:hypothetical protein